MKLVKFEIFREILSGRFSERLRDGFLREGFFREVFRKGKVWEGVTVGVRGVRCEGARV